MAELDDVVLQLAVLRVLQDQIKKRYDEVRQEAVQVLGAEGRKNATWDGQKIAAVSVSKSGRVTIDQDKLLVYVQENYPTEIENKPSIRPAFLKAITNATAEAGEPCMPDGTLGPPGVSIGEAYAIVRPTWDASDTVRRLWRERKINLDDPNILELEQ
jgi:hypothetical protein